MKKIIVFFVFMSLYTAGNTQSLYVSELTGNQNTILMSGIAFLSFQNGNLIINEKGGTKQSLPLSSIRILSFKSYTGVNVTNENGVSIRLYPNPADEVLFVQLPVSINNTIGLEILDLAGRVLLMSNSDVRNSGNSICIPIHSLKKGMYLCRIIEGEKKHTQKFIKN